VLTSSLSDARDIGWAVLSTITLILMYGLRGPGVDRRVCSIYFEHCGCAQLRCT
jgi:hypothetical protein